MIDSINTFAAVTEEQSVQTEQVAAGAQRLNDISASLIKLSENLQ
jgi:methyl-accepting chemotaxis protein